MRIFNAEKNFNLYWDSVSQYLLNYASDVYLEQIEDYTLAFGTSNLYDFLIFSNAIPHERRTPLYLVLGLKYVHRKAR